MAVAGFFASLDNPHALARGPSRSPDEEEVQKHGSIGERATESLLTCEEAACYDNFISSSRISVACRTRLSIA